MASLVTLEIDCDDLRKFPSDYDWFDNPVYAANRYKTNLNLNLTDTWETELASEARLLQYTP